MHLLNRGAFIVFEGVDRAGKSTQARMLVEFLQSKLSCKVHLLRFPDRTTEIGKLIDGCLRAKKKLPTESLHLLFSANRWELKEQIESALLRGEHVVCDRYAFSGIAFSAAQGLDFDWCAAPDKGLIKPDAVFFLDLPLEVAAARGGFGEEIFENAEMQIKVREQFGAFKTNAFWKTVSADQSVEELQIHLQKLALECIPLASNSELQYL